MSKPTVWGKTGERLKDKDLLLKYLERQTVQIDGCWIYTGGSKTVDGYRRLRIDGKIIGVHRLSAYIFLGLDLDDSEQQANHKPECSSKTCWNPQHIYVGTHKQNLLDYANAGTHNKKKTHCKRGHLLWHVKPDGKRVCKICMSQRLERIKHRG